VEVCIDCLGTDNKLGEDVVTLFFSHQAQRTQQTIIISSNSDSEAQFTLGHPFQHGSILTGSEDIHFSHFWRNKGHMANRAEDPQNQPSLNIPPSGLF